jgi:hypothetical protein
MDNYVLSGGKKDVRTPDDVERFSRTIFLAKKEYLDKCAQQDPEITRFRKSLSLFDECISLMVQDETLNKVNGINRIPSTQPRFWPFEHELLGLIRKLSEELLSRIRASIDVFDHERRRVRHLPVAKYYKRLEDYLYDEFNRLQIIVELDNFETPVDNIQLNADTAIVRLTGQHLESIRHTPWAPKEIRHHDGFALQITRKWKKPQALISLELPDPFQGLLLTALRLLKKGQVGYGSTHFTGPSPFAPVGCRLNRCR